MGSKPAILLQPRCPEQDDPDILGLLELIAINTGASWAELDLQLDAGARQRYVNGDMDGDGGFVEIRADGFEATIRIGADRQWQPELTRLVTFSLEKILLCRGYREQVSLLRGALDTTTIAVLLFDYSGDIVYANPPADNLLSRQTEDGLAVEGSGQQRQPLVTFLLSTVEEINAAQDSRPPWSRTLTLSDGSVLACEIMHVDSGGRSPFPGVLAFLQPVPALSKLCLDSFCDRHNLSPREEDVVRLLFDGLATSDMADHLAISQHTVRDHLKRLYKKTGARSRSELLSRISAAGESPVHWK
jgi:DNA-binding CsgD family transcriptional regulator/PAS domain-containing protein